MAGQESVSKVAVRGALLPLIAAVTFIFVGCSRQPKPVLTPRDFEVDDGGCLRPTTAALLNRRDLTFAAANVADVAIGRISLGRKPELVRILSTASQSGVVVDYLICKAKNRGDIEEGNREQADYLRRFFVLMMTEPTAGAILAWQNANPFPARRGSLLVTGQADDLPDGTRAVRFADNDQRQLTVANAGTAAITWWLDGFTSSACFTPAATGTVQTLDPGASAPLQLLRSQLVAAPPPFEFVVRASTGQAVPVSVSFQPRADDAEQRDLHAAVNRQIAELRLEQPDATEDTLRLLAVAALIRGEGVATDLARAELLVRLGYFEAAGQAYRKLIAAAPQLQHNYYVNSAISLTQHYATVTRTSTECPPDVMVSALASAFARGEAAAREGTKGLHPPATPPEPAAVDAGRLRDLENTLRAEQALTAALRSWNDDLRVLARADTQRVDELRQQLEVVIKRNDVLIETPPARDALSVQFVGATFFAVGSSELTPEGMRLLAQVARVLRSASPNDAILVQGHTDHLPVRSRPGDNWDLAAARATSVARVLIAAGVDARSVVPTARAFYAPAAPNDSPDGRAENRRVEIIVIPTVGALLRKHLDAATRAPGR